MKSKHVVDIFVYVLVMSAAVGTRDLILTKNGRRIENAKPTITYAGRVERRLNKDANGSGGPPAPFFKFCP